MRRLMVVVVQK